MCEEIFRGDGMIADMHTHSEFSHDSVCKIEDMCLAQIEKGTEIFAVTDHLDCFLYNDYDIFTPIANARKAVEELNKRYTDKLLILSGMEIGEGFWHLDVYKKAIGMLDCDVIIGSVHSVDYKNCSGSYATVDFTKFTTDEIYEFLDIYFHDLLKMVDATDFDILAHLTCPLRYINGKYRKEITLERFEKIIDTILEKIIEKGIALEVNTSSYDRLNSSMPDEGILKKYYSMGGRLITLGSDAHISQNASSNFKAAIEMLKRIGFDRMYYYQKRTPKEIEI